MIARGQCQNDERSRVEIINLYFFNIWSNEIELNFTICRSVVRRDVLNEEMTWITKLIVFVCRVLSAFQRNIQMHEHNE